MNPGSTSQSVEARSAETARFESVDWFLLVTAAGIWGSSFLFIDIALDAFEPGLITLLRLVFGAVTVWAIPYERSSVDRADLPRIALLGVVWMAFPLTMFPIAQQWIDSSLTGMLNGATPIAATTIAIVAFGAKVRPVQLVGVLVGLAGLVLIGLPEATTAGTRAIGVTLVVAAISSYGLAFNLAGPLQRRYGGLPVVRRAMLVAVVLTAPYGLIDAARSSFGWGALVAAVALGAGGTGVAYVAAAALAGRVGPVRGSVLTYLMPVVAIVLGVVFRDDTVTVWAVVGAAIVLLGAWLTTTTRTARSSRNDLGSLEPAQPVEGHPRIE